MKLRMTRAAALLVTSTVLALLGAACGDGYSEEDATLYCEQERVALGESCFTDETYEQCRSCYIDCGNSCTRVDGCNYTCVD
jgi:hypothetical protein